MNLSSEIAGIVGVDIARDAIAETEFQHVDPSELLDKLFVVSVPAESC